jgi:hypothetical protein
MRVDGADAAICTEFPDDGFLEMNADADYSHCSSPPGQVFAEAAESTGKYSLSYSTALAYASQNRMRLSAFARDSHFPTLHQAETGLFTSMFFMSCNGSGIVAELLLKKPTRLPAQLSAVRVIVCGTYEMFMAPRAQRNFAFEFQALAHYPWNEVQHSVLGVTEQMLNQRAHWFSEGFSTLLVNTPTAPTMPQASPPGHFDVMKACDVAGRMTQRVAQDHLASMSDQIAISNLQQLERARVQQPAATMFIDSCGHFRHILFARPDQSALQFLAGGDDDEHLAVIRIHLSGTGIEMSHPCETLNQVQRAVVASMQRILNAAM